MIYRVRGSGFLKHMVRNIIGSLLEAGRGNVDEVRLRALFTADGGGMYAMPPGSGGPMFRAQDKRTGKIVHEMRLPANVTGIPMTNMLDGVQYLVMAIGAPGVPAELIAMTVQ